MSLLPVEIPPAALAHHEPRCRAQLLHRLRTDADATATADGGGGDGRDGDAAARLEDAIVAGEQARRQLLGARRALGSQRAELLLDGGQLLADHRLVLSRLLLAGLESLLGVLDV